MSLAKQPKHDAEPSNRALMMFLQSMKESEGAGLQAVNSNLQKHEPRLKQGSSLRAFRSSSRQRPRTKCPGPAS